MLGTEDRASPAPHRGWAAGLQLAALSLRHGSDVPELLERFASTTSRCSTSWPARCSIASHRGGAGSCRRRRAWASSAPPSWARCSTAPTAARCCGASAPTTCSSCRSYWPGWFRFHHLFGQFLRLDLHAVDPDRERRLRRRAGLWMRANGHAALAVDHLVEAGELDPALSVVESRLIRYFDRGRRATITRWIERFPGEFLAARPDRCVVAATARLAGGDPGRALRWLRRWEQFPDGGDPAITARAHAVTVPALLFVGDVDGWARTALDELRCRPWQPFVPSRLLSFAARARTARRPGVGPPLPRPGGRRSGRRRDIGRCPDPRGAVDRRPGRGRPTGGRRHGGQVALAEDSPTAGGPTVFAALTRAALALEHGDPGAAAATADQVRLAGTDLGMWTTVVDAYIVLAQAHARGDAAGTFEHLAHARSLVREVGMHAAMLARIDAAEVQARIAVDDLDRAQLLLAGVPQGCRGVLEARLALARGDDDQAWARLVGGHAVRLPLRLCIEREVVLACASACRPAGRVPHRPGAGAG